VLAGGAVALGRIDFAIPPANRLVGDCWRFLLPHVTAGALAVLGLGLLGAVVLTRATRSTIRHLLAYRRVLRMLDVVGETELGSIRALLIASPRPEAFCAGLARPRIYLSSIARATLSDRALQAVLAHEAHHAHRRDPLRIFLLTVLADALFFVPALRSLRERYQELAELAADEAAIAAIGDRALLAAALLDLGEREMPGVVGIAAERVDHLLGERPRWGLSAPLTLGAFATVGGLLALVLTAAHSGQARASLASLAAQSCMVMMTAGPVSVLVAVALVGRRTISPRRR
jgi:hypothetical protein